MNSPEQTIADLQTEASMVVFANAELEANRSHVFKNLGSTAMLTSGELTVNDASVFSADDYRYFESQSSPQESEQVAYRTELLSEYPRFKGDIDRIKAELKDKPASEIVGFLASGNESDVFVTETEGTKYAVRISKDVTDTKYNSAQHIDTYVAGAFQARHLDGMEKIVAVSYEEGVTVGEIIPGRPMAEYTAEEIAAIPREHFKKLALTVVDAAKAGIGIDGNEGNLLYDSSEGFGFVDFGVMKTETRGLAQPVTTSIFGTDTWLPFGNIPASEHAEDYGTLRDVLSATEPSYDAWVAMLQEAEIERGAGAGYLTRLDELQKTSLDIKTALAELSSKGALEAYVQKSQLTRQDRIENLKKQIDKLEPGFMKDNKEASLANVSQKPGRIFPYGSIRPTRNNSK